MHATNYTTKILKYIFNSPHPLSILFLLFVFSNSIFAQLRQNNALDAKNVYNYYLYHSNRSTDEEASWAVEGDPYFTPLIDGYRYNAYRDVMVNAENEIYQTDSITLGDYTFIKTSFYPRWKKQAQKGYLIKLDSTHFLRIRKKIHEGYNPLEPSQNKRKFDLVVHYYEHIEGQIKQVKKNSDAKRRTVIQLGYNQSQLSNYEMNTLSNRNSVYYALGQRLLWKENLSFRTSFFFAKNGGYTFYNLPLESGKKIVVYNTLGIDLLVEKHLRKWMVFGGVRSTYAVKREQRLASRRRSDIRFQDLYTRLNDEFSSILFATPVGVAYEFAEDIFFEMQLNFGINSVTKSTTALNPVRLNSLQIGFSYQL